MKAFVDSGGWLSVLITTDAHHRAGARHYAGLLRSRATLVTSDYVLDEVVTRLRYDRSHRAACEFLALVRTSITDGVLSVMHIDRDIWSAAEEIFVRCDGAKLSFTDAHASRCSKKIHAPRCLDLTSTLR